MDCLNLVIERLSGNINLDRCKDLKWIDMSTIINYKGREDIQHCHFRQQHWTAQGARIHNVKDELKSFCGKVTETEWAWNSVERGETVSGWTLNKDVDDLAEQFVNEELFKKITGRSFKKHFRHFIKLHIAWRNLKKCTVNSHSFIDNNKQYVTFNMVINLIFIHLL